jgi:hypothetical protein
MVESRLGESNPRPTHYEKSAHRLHDAHPVHRRTSDRSPCTAGALRTTSFRATNRATIEIKNGGGLGSVRSARTVDRPPRRSRRVGATHSACVVLMFGAVRAWEHQAGHSAKLAAQPAGRTGPDQADSVILLRGTLGDGSTPPLSCVYPLPPQSVVSNFGTYSAKPGQRRPLLPLSSVNRVQGADAATSPLISVLVATERGRPRCGACRATRRGEATRVGSPGRVPRRSNRSAPNA